MAFSIVMGTVLFVSLALIGIALADEVKSHYRFWHVANIEKLAGSPWACRLIAEALEIDTYGECDPAEYVKWALRDAMKRKQP